MLWVGASSSGKLTPSSTLVHERPALNALLPECFLDAHTQLRLDKAQLLRAAGEAEAERGPNRFSHSPVCYEVRDQW